MSKHKPKSRQQRQASWVRRRQNIERGMKIALYEINQVLAPLDLHVHFGKDFIDQTIALAEGGRINASREDQEMAFIAKLREHATARGIPLIIII